MELYSYNKTLFFFLVILAIFDLGRGTRVGFYRTTCPKAEIIVQSVVHSFVNSNPTIAPGLLRMFFHDCFVHGCDASILLDGSYAEKYAPPNSRLRGFEVIDAAKSQLETICPGVVSCADILALAARDSVVQSGGSSWEVRTGRKDGLISLASDAANLPGFKDSVEVQIKKFADKGLNTQDLVTLTGGHTIGTTACALFSSRLYNFNHTNGPDPALNPAFIPHLQTLCPEGGDRARRVGLDTGSVQNFDISYYENLKNGRGILESDSKLWSDPRTQRFVEGIRGGGRPKKSKFNVEFGRSMVKLGDVGVKTGNKGEIRRVCYANN